MLITLLEVVRTSSPGFRPRQFSPLSPLPPETPELFPNSIEETLLQPVLKSFVTAFIQRNIDLVNKLTRAPLLGLDRSILGQISLAKSKRLVCHSELGTRSSP